MSQNTDSHLISAAEHRPGALDVFPFHIWRNEESTEMRISPSGVKTSEVLIGDVRLIRCDIPSQTMSQGLSNISSTRSTSLVLRIHCTLLETTACSSSFSAEMAPLDVDDPVIGEIAAAVMTTLPVDGHNSFTVDCLTRMLCARLKYLLEGENRIGRGQFEDWQLSVLMEALEEAADQSVSVAHIARRCRLSVCHFARLFRATFGMPLHRYRVNQRIKQAKSRLVGSSDPISQIALDCGFADQSSFTRRFTAVSGVSPAIWRRRANREPDLRAIQATASRLANA